MLTEKEQLCELWEEEQLAPLAHSRLFPLQPIGIRSPQVESLTSYIMRLADAHSVHPYTMIYREIAPRLNRSYLYQGGILVGPFGQRSAPLNGLAPTARLLVGVLEQLTSCRDLRFLTLLTYASVISQNSLVRPTQAWCPNCYEEWRRNDQIIYVPLLWTFASVRVCPVHSRYLHLHCPNPACERLQPPLALQGRIGYCPRCGQWLGDTSQEGERNAVSEDEWIWQKWIASTIGEILAAAPDLSIPLTREGFARAMAALVIERDGSPLQLARQFHVHPMAIRQWRSGQKIPQLETLLHISAHSGIAPLSLLEGHIEDSLLSRRHGSADVPSPPIQSKTQKRKINVEEVQAALEAALMEDPPQSRSQVARRLGFAPDDLNKLCPELCRAIVSRYREYQSEKRAKGLKNRCKLVQQAIRHLYDQGCFPSKRQVEKMLNKPAILRESAVKMAWEDALRELGLL